MNSVVVVDTSIVFKWVIDESDSNIALALLTEWISGGLEIHAPALIVYEVTNALHQRVRRGELSLAEAEKALAKVEGSEIVFYFSQGSTLSARALVLASYYNLPATYDAHYLALAEQEGCELWTADMRLWRVIKDKLPWVRWLSNSHPR